MTDLTNSNKRKYLNFNPYNPFDNPMENEKYNQDYSELSDEIDNRQKPSLVPETREGRKIRKYYNIAGAVLIIFALISNLLPAFLLKIMYEITKHSDASSGVATESYSYYYNIMHAFTDDTSVSIAVIVIVHLLFNTLCAFVGLKLIRVKPVELFAEPVGLDKKKFLRYSFAALGIQIIISYAMSAAENILAEKGIDITTATSFSVTGTKSVILNLIYCCIVAPITEELLFRGFAMKSLGRVSQRFAIFMSAFLFGLAHGNIPQFVTAFIVGIFMGYIDIKHNSLMPSVLVHIVLNVFSCIVTYGNATTGDMGEFIQYIISAITIAVLFAGIVSLLLTFRKDRIPYNTPEQSMRSSAMVIKSVGLVLLIIVDVAFMVLNYMN